MAGLYRKIREIYQKENTLLELVNEFRKVKGLKQKINIKNQLYGTQRLRQEDHQFGASLGYI
jgi:hypothetical protein